MKRMGLLSSVMVLGVSSLSAEVKLSEKLTRIAGHLGEGGVHFSVTDAQEDLKDLAQLGDVVIENLPDLDLPPNLKVEQLFSDLGLYSFQGRGSSSHQIGNFWHNRSFILTDGKHEGLFSLLGEVSQEPISSDFAPAGADLVLETTVDLREIERTSRKIGKAFGPEADSEIKAAFAEKITELGLSMADLFADFTVRGTIVLWLDEEKTFELEEGVSVPVPHLAARMDNAGTVWVALKSQLEADSTIVEKDGEVIVTPESGPFPTPFGEIMPTIIWNPKSQQLFAALTGEDLAVCRGDGPKLASTDSFKNATIRFPKEVSSLAYVSGDVFRLTEILTKQFLPQAPPEGQAMIAQILPYLEKLGTDGGYAAAIAVEKDGYLSVGNFPFPVKGDSSMMGLGGVSLIATLSGLATPAILKARKSADKAETITNMKVLMTAMIQFLSDKGRYPESLVELENSGLAAQLFVTGAVDSVSWVPVEGDPGSLTVFAYQELTDLGIVVYGTADGAVMSQPIEEFLKRLEKQLSR
ncbi:hypothetical protein V2O64_21800 [Verrucomicrobiaceae bacterium 227]